MPGIFDIIILRCCRDWPSHKAFALEKPGRCGICGKVPRVIDELYPLDKNKPE